MRTTILAFGIALVGLIMIAVGVWSLLVLEAEETVLLGDYLSAIGTIAGGLAMVALPRPCVCYLRLTARSNEEPRLGLVRAPRRGSALRNTTEGGHLTSSIGGGSN
jgi:hypothetical protein